MKKKEELEKDLHREILNEVSEIDKYHFDTKKSILEKAISHGITEVQDIEIRSQIEAIRTGYQGKLSRWRNTADRVLRPRKNRYDEKLEELTTLEDASNNDTDYFESQLQSLLEEKHDKIQKTENNFIRKKREIINGGEFRVIEEQYKLTKKNFKELSDSIGRNVSDALINEKWAKVLIFFLMFLEVPFTYSAFLILKSLPIVSLAVSILVALVMCLSAHFIGAALKVKKDGLITSFVFIITILLIQIVSHFRTVHSNRLDLLDSSWFLAEDIYFLIIGIAIFFICIAISYHATDSNPMFLKVFKLFKIHENQYNGIKEEIDEVLQEEEKSFCQEKERIEQEYKTAKNKVLNAINQLKSEISKIRSAFNRDLPYFKGIETKINNYFLETAYLYKNTVLEKKHTRSNGDEKSIESLNLEIVTLKSL